MEENGHLNLNPWNVSYHEGRPDLDEIMKGIATEEEYLCLNPSSFIARRVGVLVCGPDGMRDDVASLCRKRSSLCCRGITFDLHMETFEF